MMSVLAALLSIQNIQAASSPSDEAASEKKYAELRAKIRARQESLAGEIEQMMGDDTKVTLFAVDSRIDQAWKYRGKRNGIEVFRDRDVRGFSELTKQTEKTALIEALVSSLRDVSDPRVAMCFEPHDGVTIEHHGKKIDLLICFMCLNGTAYGTDTQNGFQITAAPARIISDIQRNHHFPPPQTFAELTQPQSAVQKAQVEPTIEEAFAQSTVVFSGRVIESRDTRRKVDGYRLKTVTLKFVVEKSFKGVAGKEIEVECSANTGFSVNGYYLIYAEGSQPSFVEENGPSKPTWEADMNVNGRTELSVLENLAKAK